MAVPNRLATITTPKPPLTPNQKMGNTLKNINKTAAKNKLVDKFKGMSAAQIKSAYKKMSQADKKKFGMAMFKANQANKKSSQSSRSKASTSTPESTKAPKSNFKSKVETKKPDKSFKRAKSKKTTKNPSSPASDKAVKGGYTFSTISKPAYRKLLTDAKTEAEAQRIRQRYRNRVR